MPLHSLPTPRIDRMESIIPEPFSEGVKTTDIHQSLEQGCLTSFRRVANQRHVLAFLVSLRH